MIFLETQSGSLAAHAIDMIEAPNSHGWCRVFYHSGSDARETTAHQDDVETFREQLEDDRL